MQARGWKQSYPQTVPSALIVDADDGTRLMYRAAFEPIVETIIEAEDGADALVKALREPPALVITETRLARLDGFALCSLLRNDPATQSARIVVITTAPFAGDTARALAAGADVVLVKPCAIDAVLAAVRTLWEDPAARPTSKTRERGRPSRIEPAAATTPRKTVESNPAGRIRSRTYQRHWTTTPPDAPPALVCPGCDGPLAYVNSHIGGVSEKLPEQWDYLTCERCGTFCYRHRTRKLTSVR